MRSLVITGILMIVAAVVGPVLLAGVVFAIIYFGGMGGLIGGVIFGTFGGALCIALSIILVMVGIVLIIVGLVVRK